ncbi:hypothetical protein DW658_07090 [Dorea formicigenerans]|uniref:Uncharacterized protein n=1 Tax=Dorea formicigenerans TaxID=39486 RepID=A0A414QEG2_9FIRM|nr:oligosaccharide flippase family protein [Dorea formicigenerans]RHF79157.1 hypothetical protein DW658_07090 [Dorea formicigenerans]
MEQQNDNTQTAKTAILNTVANCISLVVGMIMIPIVTRVLSTEQMGIANTFISTRNTVVIIITCSVYAYVHKAMIEFKDEKKSYIFSIIVFSILAVVISFCISLIFKEKLMKLLSLDNFLYYWLFISCLGFALYSIADYYCIFQNKYYIVAMIVLSVGPISQFLSVGLSYVLENDKYIGRVIGLDFVYLLVAVCLIVWMFVGRKPKFKTKYVKTTLAFTIPIIPHLLSQMVLTQCDLVMISYFCGSSKSGIYSMGHTVGFLALTVMSQIMASWSPWVYRRMEDKEFKTIFDNSKLIVLVGAFISIGLLTISTELIKIFLTDVYSPCIYIVPTLVVAMFFQFIYIFVYDFQFFNKKAKSIAASSIVAAIFNLITNYIFIPKFGFLAAGFTTLASYFVLLMINYFFTVRIGINKVYDIKQLFAWTIVVGVYALICVKLKNEFIVRYIMFIGFSLVLLKIKSRDLIRLLKNFK